MPEAALAFLFGLLIGSFLNVCIHRMPKDLSVVRPRSRCPVCEKQIAWYDNIPLLSYLLLRGRCRHCDARISPRYPLVELLTGLLFAAAVLHLGPTAAALKLCLFVALQVGLLFTDLEALILPDEFTLGGLGAGLLLAYFIPIEDATAGAMLWLAGVEAGPRLISVADSALGAALPAGFLWLGGWLFEKIRHKEGLGFGDVKLVAMIGAFLGLRGALLTLLAGSILGSIIGLIYIKLANKDAGTYELPFGTFLGAAAIAVAFLATTVTAAP
ncbi:MAG TPA: prepilin peptidase [Bryobacteraceae bacterium]|nr:prepilin peptidase [Bryobacteraceae bacterium]